MLKHQKRCICLQCWSNPSVIASKKTAAARFHIPKRQSFFKACFYVSLVFLWRHMTPGEWQNSYYTHPDTQLCRAQPCTRWLGIPVDFGAFGKPRVSHEGTSYIPAKHYCLLWCSLIEDEMHMQIKRLRTSRFLYCPWDVCLWKPKSEKVLKGKVTFQLSKHFRWGRWESRNIM